MALIFLDPRFRALDSTGTVLPGAKLYFYSTGTVTPTTVYTDAAAGTAAANPFILDSNGEGQVWGTGEHKVVCKDTDDVEQWTIENYLFTTSGSLDTPTGTKVLVDNCIVRGDGTTQVQESGWLIADTEVMTSPSGGNIVMADNEISGAEIVDMSETVNAVSSASNSTPIVYTAGAVVTTTLTENTTIAVPSALPASGKAGSWSIEYTQHATSAKTVAWAAAYLWAGNSAPTMSTGASAIDVTTHYTTDGGTTIMSFLAGQVMS